MAETIVISGLGAGMGYEVAKMLAGDGYTIAGFDMDTEAIKSLNDELKKIGGDHFLTTLDIRDRGGIKNFATKTLSKYGSVDVVLSNVGIGFFGPFEEVDLDKALACFDINVIGAAALFQEFLPSMRQAGRGRLVAMSSLVGKIPFPFESIYTASKFAVEGMMSSMSIELAPFGIKCALIRPAQVSTSFAAKTHFLPDEGSPYRERVERFIKKDNELIKTAPDPTVAAKQIVKVVKSKNPAYDNQLQSKDTALLLLNKFLPASMRNNILVNYMDIKA